MEESGIDRKYTGDALWTVGSFAVQALCGAVINFSILYFLNTEALGVFTQVYAIYAITGQLVVFGIHDSVLKHNAEHSVNAEDSSSHDLLRAIRLSAVLCAMGLGLVGAIALWGASGLVGHMFDSTLVSRGVLYLSPGIFFFVTNKVIIYMLNGQRQMKLFALASGARAVGILAIVIAVVFAYPQYENFGLAFTLTEVCVFVLVLSWKPFDLRADWDLVKVWILKHLNFGAKSFVHSIVAEAFIRVDVLMLGLYASDKTVGIYSFAAFFAEGIYQLPIVVRNMNNPILVKLLIERNSEKIVAFTRKTGLLSFCMTLVVAGTTAAVYPSLELVFDPTTIRESTVVVWVLLGGMAFYSIFVPFDFLFLIGGRPGIQSLFMLCNVTVNILLNAWLIPQFGLVGACSATVASFVFAGVMLNILGKLVFGLPGGLFFRSTATMVPVR